MSTFSSCHLTSSEKLLDWKVFWYQDQHVMWLIHVAFPQIHNRSICLTLLLLLHYNWHFFHFSSQWPIFFLFLSFQTSFPLTLAVVDINLFLRFFYFYYQAFGLLISYLKLSLLVNYRIRVLEFILSPHSNLVITYLWSNYGM